MDFQDYYTVLGVKKNAGEKEIRSAFRKLARQYHPDVNPGNKEAEQRFKAINEANEVLSDPEKRAIYDALGPRWREYEQYKAAGGTASPSDFARATAGAAAGAGAGAGGARGRSTTMSEEDLRDLFGGESPFSDFFGDVFGGSGGRTRTTAPARGADVDVAVEITLEDAYRGNTVTLHLTDPNGQERSLEATIPRGARDGARVRLAGQGTPGRNGGPSGDLYMVIHVRPHSRFRREGDDLHIEVPVEMTAALLGGDADVPTLKGTRLSVRIPPETQNGKSIRLRGQGMPHMRHPDTAGDLYVEVRVVLPMSLTAEERSLIQRLAELRGRTAAAAGR
jgi:curved DNA-binding protein